MNRCIGIVLLLFTLLPVLEAQKHDYVWLFGYPPNIPEEKFGGSMVDFKVNPPFISFFNIPIDLSTNCIISDSVGNLMFYTNGD